MDYIWDWSYMINFNTVGGRRFFLSVMAGVVSSILLWYGKLTPDSYALIVIATVGAYIAGSAIEQISLNKNVKQPTKLKE